MQGRILTIQHPRKIKNIHAFQGDDQNQYLFL